MNIKLTKNFIVYLLFILILHPRAFGQVTITSFSLVDNPDIEMSVERLFSSDGESYSLDKTSSISALAISGKVVFKDETGYIRVILVDEFYSEYLVYEAYSWLNNDKVIAIDKVCDETKILNNITPVTLKFEMQNASIKISKISLMKGKTINATYQQKDIVKKVQVLDKINSINRQLKKQGKKWIAGETSISYLSYADRKKKLGGKIPNLYGLEYYCGGFFEIPSAIGMSNQISAAADKYVDHFDWRNRHGENWVTPVKDNYLCNSCWAFATTGATELLVNLYYNRHLDMDLSEQDALSCSGAGVCGGGWPGQTLDYFTYNGVVDESCFPYAALDLPCSEKCTQPKELIKIGGKINFVSFSEDTLKKLIMNGPISGGIYPWNHAAMLVGFMKLKIGDTLFVKDFISNTQSWVTIQVEDSLLIGKTAWIFKNSWGALWGDNGYVYVVANIFDVGWTHALIGPVTSLNYADKDIACTDKDGDGYYTWGIGPKPAHCPACPDTADGDDSNPTLGPMDKYGFYRNLSNPVVVINTSSIVINANTIATLYQNYPNPFNLSTNISFNLPTKSFVSMKIFDLLGREVSTVVSEELSAGDHTIQWNAENLPSGVYFCRVQAGLVTQIKKLILLK